MKIKEFIIAPSESKDTRSSDTRYSAIKDDSAQDVVPQDIVSEKELALEVDSHPDHSAIAEGVSQILRRTKGGAPQKGFRCSSGPRKGRIVASPATCFKKIDLQKSAKIKKKRMMKAKTAGVKLARQKRSGAGSVRLKGAQIKNKRTGKVGKSTRPLMKSRGPVKSKIVKPKKK